MYDLMIPLRANGRTEDGFLCCVYDTEEGYLALESKGSKHAWRLGVTPLLATIPYRGFVFRSTVSMGIRDGVR
jgi:hypothetical protein